MSDSQAAASERSVAAGTIPLREAGGYPAFLSEGVSDDSLLVNAPLSEIRELRSLERFTPEHRERLHEGVMKDLLRWDAPPRAVEVAGMLRQENVYAVVTGQQAGIATGPLYTLYKAIGAICAADELARLHPGRRFVPVFWIEADDHDFDEARMITVIDRTGNPATIAYDDGDARQLHVGDRMNNRAGFEAFIAQLREALPATEFTEEALRIVLESYRTGDGSSDEHPETLADGFARAFYAIAGDLPIVLLSSRNPSLKRLASDVIAREAADPLPLYQAVEKRTAVLAAEGRPTPITPKPGGLFITHEGERRSLEVGDGGYTIKGTDLHLTFADAAELARTAPERFSPNVVLRPLVQDAILPTALYLGGPSEVAYLDQILTAYDIAGIDAPAVAPRPFVLLLEPKVRRILESSGIGLETLLSQHFDAADLLIDKEKEEGVETAKERARHRITEAYAELEEITRSIDPTLEKTLGASTTAALKGIEDFAKRLNSSLRRKQQTEIDRLSSARTLLMPKDTPQERVTSPLYIIAKYGLPTLRQALASITLAPGQLQLIEI